MPGEISGTTIHRAEIRRVDTVEPGGVKTSLYLQDVMMGSILLISLAACFQANANYSTRPFLALILPVLFFAASRSYRRRLLGRLRRPWVQIDAYSKGVGPIPWTSATLLASAPAWVFYLSNGHITDVVDTVPVIPTAESLLTEGNLELSEYLAKGREPNILDPGGVVPRCIISEAGKSYSSYPAGMVPFAVAVTGLSQLAGADLTRHIVQLRLPKLTASLVASVCVGLFYLIALRLGSPMAATTATAILATCSGMFSTVALGLWQHGGIILWSMVILLVEFQPRNRGSRIGLIVQGIACAQMITCRLTSISFLVPFFAWTFLRDPRRSARLLGVAMLCYLPWAWLYLSIYGGPFGPSTAVLSHGLWTPDVVTPLAGLILSPGRGLLVYQPWILLALTALLPGLRSRGRATSEQPEPAGWRPFALATIACHFALISAWGCWWGGWCWGSRLVVETVPLFALLCVQPIASLGRSIWGRSLIIGLALLGFLAQCPLVYSTASRWNETAIVPADLWSWSRAPFLNPEPRGPAPDSIP